MKFENYLFFATKSDNNSHLYVHRFILYPWLKHFPMDYSYRSNIDMWRQLDDRAFFDFYARDAMLPVRVYPSVCHKPVLYRNDWIDPAVFSMDTSFHPKIRVPPKTRVLFSKNFVPNSGLRQFRYGKSIWLSTKLVNA